MEGLNCYRWQDGLYIIIFFILCVDVGINQNNVKKYKRVNNYKYVDFVVLELWL